LPSWLNREPTKLLFFVYAGTESIYKIFSSLPLLFYSQTTVSVEGAMDIIYIGAIVVFLAVTCAFTVGCDKLGERK